MTFDLYTTSYVDAYGRKILTSDQVRKVVYYDSSTESWDKEGSAGQSWYSEIYSPSDSFDSAAIYSDRWTVLNSAVSSSSVSQDGSLNISLVKSEGILGLTSFGKWSFSGDFEVKLYFDWSTYRNEYRSVIDYYLKVYSSDSNAVRVSFNWDKTSYCFRSQKTLGRSIKFFDWQSNGSKNLVESFDDVKEFLYLKISRVSGKIKCYIHDGLEEIQLGSEILNYNLENELYLEFGLDSKEYNTSNISYSKVEINGNISPTIKFFNDFRGEKQKFPDISLLVLDDVSLSIVDLSDYSLWMRFKVDSLGIFTGSQVSYSISNGVLVVSSEENIFVVDFIRDRIYKYVDGDIYRSVEGIALRNSPLSFLLHIENIGDFPQGTFKKVHTKYLSGSQFVAFTTASGAGIFRTLASGVGINTESVTPCSEVVLSDSGTLYWAGYDQTDNYSVLSYRTNASTLSGSFTRTGYYDSSTFHSLYGSPINTVAVSTVAGSDLVALGSPEGIAYFSFSPPASAHGSVSYGAAPSINPVSDPSFENYLGLDWLIDYNGFQENFIVERSSEFVSDSGNSSVKMYYTAPGGTTSTLVSGTYGGIYQPVNLTGVNSLYVDLKFERSELVASSRHVWTFKVKVGSDTVKSFSDLEPDYTKIAELIDVSGYSGVHNLGFYIEVDGDNGSDDSIATRVIYVDNIRTSSLAPDHPILSYGQTNVKELLIQYDSSGKKLYYATTASYGAIDLIDNTLDYVVTTSGISPGMEVNGGDFVRSGS